MVKIVQLKGFKLFNDGTRDKNDPSSNDDRESEAKEYILQSYITLL